MAGSPLERSFAGMGRQSDCARLDPLDSLLYNRGMSEHRISLTDEDIALIIPALVARRAMAGPARAHRIDRLAARLGNMHRGNPKWIFDELSQAHEDERVWGNSPHETVPMDG